MLFHSYAYSALLVATILLCLVVPARLRWTILLAASAAFYVAWNPAYLGLLLITSASCHFVALHIESLQQRSFARLAWLLSVVTLNLAILFLFKYFGLFAASSNQLLGSSLPTELGLLLPVGISFYTFQAIGYTVDVYQRKVTAESNLFRSVLFISFFPQLVAGPIERAGRLLPNLRKPIFFRWRNIRLGSWLILWGLFKKVVIADRLSLLVDVAYDSPDAANGAMLLVATYAFAFQIYCDFSGYSDMAIGSARLFGIDLMANFRNPYFATSLRDFWSRWHISLSTWFRDYVYIPLGGSRVGKLHWAFNILAVFGVSGLWHGAQWTFVIWGLIHGAIVLIESLTLRTVNKDETTHWSIIVFKTLLTFHIVLFAWIFFRASSWQDSLAVVQKIAAVDQWTAFAWPAEFSRFETFVACVGLFWMLGVEAVFRGNVKRVVGIRPRLVARLLVVGTVLLVLNFGIFNHPNQFVYFQF